MKKSEKTINFLDYLINLAKKLKQDPLKKGQKIIKFNQRTDGLCDYHVIHDHSRRKSMIVSSKDRVIPISKELINEYNQETGSTIEKAEVRCGPNANDLLRDYHANALTLGMAIYICSRAYKPETEEGRKTLVHELTHIKQNQEDILEGQKTVEELEGEAEKAEKIADTIKEKYRYIDYRGEKIKVTEKKYREIMQQVKEYVENEILDNTMRLNEIDYLDLLLKYERLESQEQLIWQK